jgi:hypothetical protein
MRSTPLHFQTLSSQPTKTHTTHNQHTSSHGHTNFYYRFPNRASGPLPAELMTRQTLNSSGTNKPSNNTMEIRAPSRTDTEHGRSTIDAVRDTISSFHADQMTMSAMVHSSTKRHDNDQQKCDRPNTNNVVVDKYFYHAKVKICLLFR